MSDSSSYASMMIARVQSCFREILPAVAQGRLAGSQADRRAMLDAIRVIKNKAIEAEVLLRSVDRRSADRRALTESDI